MSAIRFGTDGVRGKVGTPPIDANSFYRIGLCAGRAALALQAKQAQGEGKQINRKVLLATDTRASGEELQLALYAGFTEAGLQPRLAGVMPTAALALIVRETGACLGAMLTASHNPAGDNGIKLFAAGGQKIPDPMQAQIENLLGQQQQQQGYERKLQNAIVDTDLAEIYRKFITNLTGVPLIGLQLVVDCAHGSASGFAPDLLRAAGAKVTELFARPDGHNINLACGSTYPLAMQEQVIREGADLGIAFDGDADRLVLCDEKGQLLDGDQILAALATLWQRTGRLKTNKVVATVMSNLGLQEYLQEQGLELVRTKVGDRHVSAGLASTGANLGGEQSGHILMPDILPSGDGLAAAMQILAILAKSDQPASTAIACFTPMPQILRNHAYSGPSPLHDPHMVTLIAKTQKELGNDGRLLVRASGTEPLIRVMVEATSQQRASQIAQKILDAL